MQAGGEDRAALDAPNHVHILTKYVRFSSKMGSNIAVRVKLLLEFSNLGINSSKNRSTFGYE